MIMYPSLALLSRENLQSLNPSEIRVLQYMFDIFRVRKNNIRLVDLYITPGRKIISEKVDRCEATISRATTSLMEKGLIWKTRRRKVNGMWQTCLYRLGDKILCKIPWIWKKIQEARNNHVTEKSHIEKETSKDFSSKELFSIKELIAMMGFPGFSP